MKMKVLDKKIGILRQELYENASSLKSLKKQNIKISRFMEKIGAARTDLYFLPDIFSYFRSLQDILSQNKYFAKIIDALKNEIYLKPSVSQDEDALLQSITLPEKALYSQWILQTLTKKLSKKKDNEKFSFSSSLEISSYLEKLMTCCNISIADVYPATLSILNNMSFKTLSDNEQDLLIFMHLTARIQSIFELMRAVDCKYESSQLLSSKVKRYEIQKKYLDLLYKLKHLLDGIENIDLSRVFQAITKPKDAHGTEGFSEAFRTFEDFLTHASGQISGILEIMQLEKDSLVDSASHELAFKIQQSIDQGTEKISVNFGLNLLFEEFDENVKFLICDIKKFIQEMLNMSINDINDCRKLLNCLKTQIKFVLQSKWNLQRHLLPIVCKNEERSYQCRDTNVLLTVGRSQLLFEYLKNTMFYLKTLEEMEFRKHFSVMSSLCDLRERKDVLIQKFKNLIVRIGHQRMNQIPTIKKNLLELNKEIQILFSDYQKFRLKLQFLNPHEERNLRHLFEDIEAVVMADFETYKDKKSVGLMPVKKLNVVEYEAAHKKSKDNIEEIRKIVDETREFLHSLDETIISKEFSAMRYLCELHCIKEQILSSFEVLLDSMFQLIIQDDDLIISRLDALKSAADGLIRKYETLGMQLMLFSDIMALMNMEKVKTSDSEKFSSEESVMNISELFGSTEDLKKRHQNLDGAIRHKWFPAKTQLFDMHKDKERTIQAFQNFLDRLPELDIHNTLDVMQSLEKLILNAENVLRKCQSLRMQLIWIADDGVFNIKHI